jgi:DNA-binding MarR family transcriptional regulator
LSTVVLVGRMERRGLLQREPCADDARAVEITVTPEGRPEERAVVTEVLTRVLDHLDQPG